VDACDLAQFLQVLAGRGEFHAQGLAIKFIALLTEEAPVHVDH